MQAALALQPSDYPQVKQHRRKPSENITSAVAMLQLLLKVKADVHGIASPMIADKDDLEAIALGKSETPALHRLALRRLRPAGGGAHAGQLKLSFDPKKKKW